MRQHVLFKHFFLALPLCAWILLTGAIVTAPALADGAASPPASQSPLPAGAGGSGHLAVDMRTVASKKISLSIKDGKDYIPAIANALAPTPIVIAVRGPKPFHASLKVSQMPVEDVLRGIAGLSHCELYIFPNYFLIAPPSQLRPDEKATVAGQASGGGDASGESDTTNVIKL